MNPNVIENDPKKVKAFMQNFVPVNYYSVLGDAYLSQVRAVFNYSVMNYELSNPVYDKLISDLTINTNANSQKIDTEVANNARTLTAISERLDGVEDFNTGAREAIEGYSETINRQTESIGQMGESIKSSIKDVYVGAKNLIRNSDLRFGNESRSDTTVTIQEVGIGNIIRCSPKGSSLDSFGVNSGEEYNTIKLTKGVQYTLSFYAYGSVEVVDAIEFISRVGPTISIPVIAISGSLTDRHVYTFTAPETAEGYGYNFLTKADDETSWFSYTQLQLERGNTATDWKCAPEDLTKERDLLQADVTYINKTAASTSKTAAELGEKVAANHLANSAEIEELKTTSASKYKAQAEHIRQLQVNIAQNNAAISDVDTAYASKYEALAQRATALEAETEKTTAKIVNVDKAISTNTKAVAESEKRMTASIGGIQVGGRNLLVNSDFTKGEQVLGGATTSKDETVLGKTSKYTSTTGDIAFGLQTLDEFSHIRIEKFQPYTLSLYAQGSAEVTELNHIYIKSVNGQVQKIDNIKVDDTFGMRLSQTFYGEFSNNDCSLIIGCRDYPAGSWFKIASVKLERGNRATDYTTAPEDIEGYIDEVSADLTEYKIVEARKDRALVETYEALEARTLVAEGRIDETDRVVSTLDGAVATHTKNIKTNYDNSTQALADAASAAVIAKRADAASVRANTDISLLEESVSNAQQAQVKREENIHVSIEQVAGDVAALQGGARNLLIQSQTGAIEGQYLKSTGILTAHALFRTSPYIPVEAGKKYITSGKSELDFGSTVSHVFYDVDKNYISGFPGRSRIVVTAPDNAAYIRFSFQKSQYADVMFQIGDKASKWSPAPEDTTKEIDDLKLLVSDIDTYVDQATIDGIIDEAEAKQLNTVVLQLNTEKGELAARITTFEANNALDPDEMTKLRALWNKYGEQHTSLTTFLKGVVTAGVVTDSDKDSLDAEFDFYKAALANLAVGFEHATDSIGTSRIAKVQTAVDKTITGTTVQYYLSNSSSSLTGGSWSVTAPKWVDGKFMWSKTVTTYVDSPDHSSNPVNISGAKGATGSPGLRGPQGVAGLEGANGSDGIPGIDGANGRDGLDGRNGTNGKDGTSSYTHIAYATSKTGGGFNVSHFESATYIGMYVDSNVNDSSDYRKYNWSLIKGADGRNGIAGKTGTDGRTTYLHIAYANNSNGSSGFSTTDSANKLYIGQYTDYTKADSSTASKYRWSKLKGDKGDKGATGPRGPQGAAGLEGADGADGIPGINGRNGVDGTDGSDGRNGTNGVDGADGKDAFTNLIGYEDVWTVGKTGTQGAFSRNGSATANQVINAEGPSGTPEMVWTDNESSGGASGGWNYNSIPIDHTKSYRYSVWMKEGAGESHTLYLGCASCFNLSGSNNNNPYFWTGSLPKKDKWYLVVGILHGSGKTDSTASGISGVYDPDTGARVLSGTDFKQRTDINSQKHRTYRYYARNSVPAWFARPRLEVINGEELSIGLLIGRIPLNSYTHLAYATGTSGQGFSTTHFSSATYIGMYVDNTAADSTSHSSYKWSLIKGADGANGIAGKAGANGKTTYLHIAYANNSNGTSGFSTTASAGKLYIGQYTDYTQADSSTASKYNWTKIKGETGSKGSTGATGAKGKGVSSITAEYNLSTSKTSANGSWTTTAPTWSPGKYVWTRSKIVYKDPTSTAYTVAICDSSWEAVNLIEVGGRNIMTNSQEWGRKLGRRYGGVADTFLGRKDVGYVNAPRTTMSGFNQPFSEYAVPGNPYTFSVMVAYEGAKPRLIRLYAFGGTYTTMANVGNLAEGKWVKIWLIRDPIGTGSIHGNHHLHVYTEGDAPSKVYFTDAKAEKGNIATDWSPAPEDIQKNITDSKAAADAAAKVYTDAQNKLKVIENNAYADGIVDAEERRAIKDAADKLKAAKADATTKMEAAKLAAKVHVISSTAKKFVNPASYNNSGSNRVGYIIIHTPIKPSRMVNLAISGYNYKGSTATIDLAIGFYNQSRLYNYNYTSKGAYPITKVQIAKKADGSAMVIIGLANSRWDYPKIVVDSAIIGHSNPPNSYKDGWSITISPTIPEYAQIVNVPGVDTRLRLTEINKDVADVTREFDKFEGDFNSFVKDGIIDEAEARALKNSINLLNVEKADLDKRYSNIKANSDVSASSKNALTGVYNTYKSKHTELVWYIGEAIKEKKITSARATEINNRFSRYRTALANLSNGFELAVDSVSATRIDDIKIGGVNLLKKSATKVSTTRYNLYDYPLTEKLKTGEVVTLTLWGTLAATKNSFRAYNSGGSTSFGVITKIAEGVYQKTFSWRSNSNNSYLRIYHMNSSDPGTSTIKRIKLEKGNKPTDWSISPEDVVDQNIKADAYRTKIDETVVRLDGARNTLQNTMRAEYQSSSGNLLKSGIFPDTMTTLSGTGWRSGNGGLLYGQTDYLGTKMAIRIQGRSSDSYLLYEGGRYLETGSHTLSYWIKANKTQSINVQMGERDHKTVVTATTSWKKHTMTANITNLGRRYMVTFGGWNSLRDTGLQFYISHVKIEKDSLAIDQNTAEITRVEETIAGPDGSIAKLQDELTTTGKVTPVDITLRGNSIADWIRRNGSGTPVKSGHNMLVGDPAISATWWGVHKDLIRVSKNQIYRITFRIKKQSASGYSARTYFGAEGVAENKTTLVNSSGSNSSGSQHYCKNTTANYSKFTDIVCHIAVAGTDMTGLSNVDYFHSKVAFFRPLIICNYSNQRGTVEVEYIRVETLNKELEATKASIKEVKESVAGTSNSWSIESDINGNISGIYLDSIKKRSEVKIISSKFKIVDANGRGGGNPFKVVGGVVYADNLKVKAANIDKASITSLSALSANIGHFKSADSGRRLEIKDSVLLVYDADNNLRVRLGIW